MINNEASIKKCSVNEDMNNYEKFIKEYLIIAGNSFNTITTDAIDRSDLIVMLGTRITSDNLSIKNSISNAVLENKTKFIYMHPIDDIQLEEKYTQFIKYEAGSEEGVIALLLSYLITDVPNEYISFFEELDIGNLSGECSVGEEEIEGIVSKFENGSNNLLIIGEDLYSHPQAANIAKMVALIEKYSSFEVRFLLSEPNKLEMNHTVNEVVEKTTIDDVTPIDTYNGTVIYMLRSENKSNNFLQGSTSFATAAKIKNGDRISISYKNKSIIREFILEDNLKGTIALCPFGNKEMDSTDITLGYRFKQVKIEKIENEEKVEAK